jgi:predicted GTPase
VETIITNARKYNSSAVIIKANSPIFVTEPEMIRNKKVLVIEDGPTVTHGDMSFGAGYLAAKKYDAKEVIDPRPYAVGSIKQVFEEYPQTKKVLPSTGYSKKQIKDLEETINASPCETVIIATPVNLGKIININKRWVRATYEIEEVSKPTLEDIIQKIVVPIRKPSTPRKHSGCDR